MEYKAIINGSDESGSNKEIEFTIEDNSDKLKITVGYNVSTIDISEYKKIERLIAIKEEQQGYKDEEVHTDR
jgi:hypothetical protein